MARIKCHLVTFAARAAPFSPEAGPRRRPAPSARRLHVNVDGERAGGNKKRQTVKAACLTIHGSPYQIRTGDLRLERAAS